MVCHKNSSSKSCTRFSSGIQMRPLLTRIGIMCHGDSIPIQGMLLRYHSTPLFQELSMLIADSRRLLAFEERSQLDAASIPLPDARDCEDIEPGRSGRMAPWKRIEQMRHTAILYVNRKLYQVGSETLYKHEFVPFSCPLALDQFAYTMTLNNRNHRIRNLKIEIDLLSRWHETSVDWTGNRWWQYPSILAEIHEDFPNLKVLWINFSEVRQRRATDTHRASWSFFLVGQTLARSLDHAPFEVRFQAGSRWGEFASAWPAGYFNGYVRSLF